VKRDRPVRDDKRVDERARAAEAKNLRRSPLDKMVRGPGSTVRKNR
jgi:hypothetical protein